MTPTLTALTAEQHALLPAIRDEWITHGLSCEPANRAEAEAGVRLAYQAANLPAPSVFIWLDSPYRGSIAASLLGQVRGQVRDQVRDQVWDQVRDQVWDQVWGQVRDQVWDQVADQVADQVRDQVWDQVRDQVWDQVWGQVGDQVAGQVYRAVYGPHDAGWLAFCDAFDRIGVAVTAHRGLAQVARNAGWWWPFTDAVILTDRPSSLSRDEQHRLHSLTGPAIAYRDGWSVYAIHGIRVPERYITAFDTLTAQDIAAEAIAEVRRVLIDRFTPARYLQDIGAKKVHTDDTGTLWRAPLAGDEPIQMVEVVNGTPEADGTSKVYWLRVPPTVRTCREAVAWTYGLKESEYAEVVRT